MNVLTIRPYVAALLASLSACSVAAAHHSFAVHFVPEEIITLSGVVTDFRFRNPHGVVTFNVTSEDGSVVEWRAETNSPNILRRRGWSGDSIEIGDEILIEGYPARDGGNFMRIYRVILDRGELIGQRPAVLTTGEQD